MRLRLEALETLDPATSRSCLERLGGHPLHIPELWKILYGKARVSHLVFHGPEGIAGLALGVAPRSRLRVLSRGAQTLVVPFAPSILSGDPGVVLEVLQALLGHAISRGQASLEVNWTYGPPAGESFFRELGGEVTRKIEFLIDLGRPEAELLGSYHPGRSKHQKAAKRGLSTEIATGWEDLLELRSMQLHSSQRAATKENLYEVGSEKYYASVYDACMRPGHSRILFAKQGSRRVSGLMFLVHASKAVVQRGGSIDDAFDLDASRYLHYALIGHLQQIGCTQVWFGAVPAGAVTPGHPEHALYLFKKGFPATESPAYVAKVALGRRPNAGGSSP